MALTPEQLAAMADTTIDVAEGPLHVGTGEQYEGINGEGITVINGDNPNGISQNF
ncbi:hypothetical protein [Streptomyces griseorubiginosus]|uniref:hypothetical protein n=1 Tax=Streptomyces griseorubiginosus TaxID=67304 RepID=UPI0036E4C43B